VLVVVDSSASARLAIEAVLNVTGAHLSSVTIVGVRPRLSWALSLQPVPIGTLEADAQKEIHNVCLDACARVPRTVNARHLVMQGQFGHAVTDHWNEGHYDLAVVCRPSRGRFVGWARAHQLGRLMRRSAIPFMCIPMERN